jgi:putative membrane protein
VGAEAHGRGKSDHELANDRTFLAWLRTGIALYGLGFVVAKVALIVQPNAPLTNQDLYASVGIAFVLCGGALVLVGYVHHKTVLDDLRTDNAGPRPRWPLTITATAIAAGLLLSVLIGVST